MQDVLSPSYGRPQTLKPSSTEITQGTLTYIDFLYINILQWHLCTQLVQWLLNIQALSSKRKDLNGTAILLTALYRTDAQYEVLSNITNKLD